MSIIKEASKGASEVTGRAPQARERALGATKTTRDAEEAGRTSKAADCAKI